VDPGAALKRRLAIVLALAVLPACAGHQLDIETLSSTSDETVWNAGVKAQSKKDWESARKYFRRLIDAFPQSVHQPDARIALADTYFAEGGTGNYVLAVSSYREFLTLYPQHARSDYAQYQAAEAYYKQKNSPDRDQTATRQALEEYERLLDAYPQSGWIEKARERIHDCRQALARAHYQVGYFYQKTRKSWRSAIGRYQTILTDYPDYERVDEVLFRLAQCLSFAGRYAEARPQIARLRTDFPDSAFVAPANALEASFPPSATPAPEPPPKPDTKPVPPKPSPDTT
jgi:outer membrane protein assembly factor BamD